MTFTTPIRARPFNGAGACGAALADLGLPVDLLRGFALLARTAGLLGHLAEERHTNVGMQIYQTVDRHARYLESRPRSTGGPVRARGRRDAWPCSRL